MSLRFGGISQERSSILETMTGECFQAGDIFAQVLVEIFPDIDKQMDMIGHYAILEQIYLWGEALPFEEGIADSFACRRIVYLHIISAMLESSFTPAVGKAAERGGIGIFKDSQMIFPGGFVVVAFHAMEACSLWIFHKLKIFFEAEAFASCFPEAEAFASCFPEAEAFASSKIIDGYRLDGVIFILMLAGVLTSGKWREV